MRFSLWTRRRLARGAVACVIAITASLFSALPAIAGEKAVDRSFSYTCQLPSGTQQVAVRVIATAPDTATAGRPIRLGNVTVLVALPASAVADLTKQGATTVGGTLRLTPLVTVNGSPARITGSDFVVPETSVGADQLVLAGSGQEPAPTVAAPGRVVFSVADLSASLTLRQADGTAAQPATMSLSCSPNIGQDTVLTTVAVSASDAPSASGPGTVSPATAAKAQEDLCPPDVTGGFSEDFPLPELPPDTEVFQTDPRFACAKISGFSNVAKLNGAAPLFGKMALAVGNRSAYKLDPTNPTPDNNYFETDSIGESHVETSQATFLAFGFMPTTAELDVTQVGKTTAFQNANITAVDYAQRMPGLPARYTTASAYVSLRVHDVRINGVPLDVGADCTTTQPMELQLSASTDDDPNYVVNTGGFLSGMATIPPFHGCGVGENLDPLFTASISGPGNYIRITQGPICDTTAPLDPASPCPVQDFGWDVEPGGTLTASASPFRMTFSNSAFSCDSASFTLSLNGGKTVDGGINNASQHTLTNCHGEGALSQAATITIQSRTTKLELTTYDPTTDVVSGELRDFNAIIRDGTSCTVRINGGQIGFRYSNVTHEMSLTRQSSGLLNVGTVTGCGGKIKTGDPVDFSAIYVFSAPEKIVRPGYK